MEDVERMLARVRSAADANGIEWLRAQLSAVLPDLEKITVPPAPELPHTGRSRPPPSSPDLPPRGRRRPGSPVLDPSAPTAKRTPALWSGGAGRNPLHRRTPGEECGSPPSSTTPSADQRDHVAYTADVLPAAGAAWRGRESSTSSDQMPGATGTATKGSRGTTGDWDAASATQSQQTEQRGRRAVASDFFSHQPLEEDRSEGELTTSEDGEEAASDVFSQQPWEEDRSEGKRTTLEERVMDARDVFSQRQMHGQHPSGLPWKEERSENARTTSKEGTVDHGDDPLPGSNTGLQGSVSTTVLSDVAGQSGSERLVWILGHDYVVLGAEHAALKPEGLQLGFPREQVRIRWIGVPGMLWSRVMPEVHRYSRLDRPPDVLLFHVGGNDLGIRPSRELSMDIKSDFLRLRSMFPDTVVVWSDIVARTSWKLATSVSRLNKAKIKVNKEVAKCFVCNGGLAIRHSDMEKEPQLFLREDGVHLNSVGIDLWSLGLQEGIERALRVWRAAHA